MNNTYRVYFGFHFHAENELLAGKLASAFDSLYRKKSRSFSLAQTDPVLVNYLQSIHQSSPNSPQLSD